MPNILKVFLQVCYHSLKTMVFNEYTYFLSMPFPSSSVYLWILFIFSGLLWLPVWWGNAKWLAKYGEQPVTSTVLTHYWHSWAYPPKKHMYSKPCQESPLITRNPHVEQQARKAWPYKCSLEKRGYTVHTPRGEAVALLQLMGIQISNKTDRHTDRQPNGMWRGCKAIWW